MQIDNPTLNIPDMWSVCWLGCSHQPAHRPITCEKIIRHWNPWPVSHVQRFIELLFFTTKIQMYIFSYLHEFQNYIYGSQNVFIHFFWYEIITFWQWQNIFMILRKQFLMVLREHFSWFFEKHFSWFCEKLNPLSYSHFFSRKDLVFSSKSP